MDARAAQTLPPELRDAAGTLLATLWERAAATAHTALEEVRAEMRLERDAAAAEVAAAREAAAHAERTLEEPRAERQALQAQLGDSRQHIGTLEGSLAALQRASAEAEKARRARQRIPTQSALGRTSGPIRRPRPPTRALKKTS
ncbi:DNA-binding protein [Mycetohabitans rhizoxinica]|uniref:DNA-binding protein n=1 Tax=Mycetohabitans rhizoxinica TaxID=412963 RepID=UPI0030CBF037